MADNGIGDILIANQVVGPVKTAELARAAGIANVMVAIESSVNAAQISEAAVRARSTVAAAAEEVLRRAGHALGPAPLALDEVHARRVADLTVYLRQHHAERDVARLGELVLAEGPTW